MQIRQCDGVLDGMESMLRGFQGDLANISAQIKFLQDESLSMNVKLRNRKAAETQLSGFIDNLGVTGLLDAYFGTVQHWDKSWQRTVDKTYGTCPDYPVVSFCTHCGIESSDTP